MRSILSTGAMVPAPYPHHQLPRVQKMRRLAIVFVGLIVLIFSAQANATLIAAAQIAPGFISCQNVPLLGFGSSCTIGSGGAFAPGTAASTSFPDFISNSASATYRVTGVTGNSYVISFPAGSIFYEALVNDPLVEGARAGYGVRVSATNGSILYSDFHSISCGVLSGGCGFVGDIYSSLPITVPANITSFDVSVFAVAEVVPEPSSLIILLGSLIGLTISVLYGKRRPAF